MQSCHFNANKKLQEWQLTKWESSTHRFALNTLQSLRAPNQQSICNSYRSAQNSETAWRKIHYLSVQGLMIFSLHTLTLHKWPWEQNVTTEAPAAVTHTQKHCRQGSCQSTCARPVSRAAATAKLPRRTGFPLVQHSLSASLPRAALLPRNAGQSHAECRSCQADFHKLCPHQEVINEHGAKSAHEDVLVYKHPPFVTNV